MSFLNLQEKKTLIALTIGSIFELFDFLVFVFLSSIMTSLFFPKSMHGLGTILTSLTIAISYFLRPIGGIVLGHLGDKYGRKSVFTLSILLMSVPSFVIGFLPTFNQIGYIATVILVIARMLQGFSVGGEVPGSITYISENFKNKNFYFYCVFLTFGANIGVALAAQSINLLYQLTSPQFVEKIGWRIPFLFGGLLTIIGFYIRKSVNESSLYLQLKRNQQISKVPLLTLFQNYKSHIISGVLLCIVVSLTTSLFHVFLPNLFIKYFNFNLINATNISSLGSVTMALFSFLFAYLTRYFKPLKIIQAALIGQSIILMLILFQIIELNHMLKNNILGLYILVFVISLFISGVNGIFFGILASLFPTQVRFSGISICYNVAYILGAGITPIWTTSILQFTGSYHYIILIGLVITFISLINTVSIKKLIHHTYDKKSVIILNAFSKDNIPLQPL